MFVPDRYYRLTGREKAMAQQEAPQDLLKAVFSLDHIIKVYLPNTQDTDGQVNGKKREGLLAEGLTLFASLFGGATAHEAIGAWQSATLNKLVTERVTIVENYATKEAIEEGLQAVLDYCQRIKAELAQEAISLEYDNRLYFI